MLIDARRRPGEKILLSGGGRCNILPLEAAPTDYVTDASVHSVRKILSSWELEDVRAFLEGPIGLRLVEQKRTGKVFPATGGGVDVRDRFVGALKRAGVKVRTGTRVVDVLPHERRRVVVDRGAGIVAEKVILATGGCSYPQTGSDGSGMVLAARLGHQIVPPYPALVPLFGGTIPHHRLSGLSLPVRARVVDPRGESVETGDFLFTHLGYSGPLVLNLSHRLARTAQEGSRAELWISWMDQTADAWEARLQGGRGTLRGTVKEVLPDRLADVLLEELGLWDAQLSALRREERKRLIKALTEYRLPWMTCGGFDIAEVTGGGIPLGEVNPRTLQSRTCAPVHVCGELLDAFGRIGGYNFLWAFVTGRLAGLGATA